MCSSLPKGASTSAIPSMPRAVSPRPLATTIHPNYTTRTQLLLAPASVIQKPFVFADGLKRKALYLLGWFEALRPGEGYSSFYLVWWIAACWGIARTLQRPPDPPRYFVSTIPAWLALAHFTVMTIVFPLGERGLLPMYVLLIPYVGVAVGSGVTSLQSMRRHFA